jgi:histidine triad (HIT) family protein
MNLTPEIKAQLQEQKKQCIHCKLISGEQPGAKTVFKDNKTTAMLDIYPFVKGHTSFMTIEHYPMPAYIPGDEFTQMFALIPDLAKALQTATVSRGFNVFIAVGGVAGQTSPHFLVHLLPRDPDDNKDQFTFRGQDGMDEKNVQMLAQNMPIMMTNHFKRHPANWHLGKGNVPAHLSKIYEDNHIIYEDEQVLCIAPKVSHGKAHFILYSKDEKKDIRKLTQAQSAHLFFAASFASTALFEGLKCHATNIILKSGQSKDNPKEQLAVHVFGRWQEDGLEKINWQPKQTQENLDPLAKEIKSNALTVKYKNSKQQQKSPSASSQSAKEPIKKITTKVASKPGSIEDQILRAIKRAKK